MPTRPRRAQANNNALPPDLSLMAKAREGGAGLYLFAADRLPTIRRPGYQVPPNLHYNPYFANLNIAMPPPLTADGQVTYAAGTPATRDADGARRLRLPDVGGRAESADARTDAGLVGRSSSCSSRTILGYMAYQNIWHGPRRRESDPSSAAGEAG